MTIIYLHGFNSAPRSHKARILCERMAALGRGGECIVPALPHWPAEAVRQAGRLIEEHSRAGEVCLVGSSLGGYYAARLAEMHDLRAVLINPAVEPAALLQEYLGVQRNLYTGEEYVLTAEHLAQLRALDPGVVRRPERFLLMLQTGDEVLDYRLALERFRGAAVYLEEGGDHAFRGFDILVDKVLEFCHAGPLNREYTAEGIRARTAQPEGD